MTIEDLESKIEQIQKNIEQCQNNFETKLHDIIANLSNEFKKQINDSNNKLEELKKELEKLRQQQKDTNYSLSLNKPKYSLNSSNEVSQERNNNIPENYFINFSIIRNDEYIKTNYPDWLKNLEDYNQKMAECRKYKQVQNFCNYGRKIIESAIVIFFEQECKRIKSNNSNFLNAYNQVKTFYDSNKWELPQIYVEGKNIDIKSSNYLFFEDIYVSIEAIDSILKTNFPVSLDILCRTINPNFMLTKSVLRTNYFIIKDMHSLRNIEDHGSSISLEERLKKLKSSARKLYYEPEIFDKLTISIKWFMQEIYKRVCQLSNQS